MTGFLPASLPLESIRRILRSSGVTEGALFGSFVRGEQNPNSDVDILVRFSRTHSLTDLIRLRDALEGVLQRKVDVVSYNGLSPILRDRILSESVSLDV